MTNSEIVIPTSILIGSNRLQIELVPDLKSAPDENDKTTGYYGLISHVDLTIKIEKNMHIDTQVVALLHEAMHGIIHRGGHHDISGAIEERLTQCLSHGVIALLKNNPDFADLIMSKQE